MADRHGWVWVAERRLRVAALAFTVAATTLAFAALAVAQTFTSDQQRISAQGTEGNSSFQGFDPAIAYNPTANEYLVVWRGDTDADFGGGALVNGEDEIFGRIVGPGGAPMAPAFRISDMGPDGNASFDAREPAVAYNPAADEFLVVWRGDDDTGMLVDGADEIFGQRLDADGAEIGTNDFRISAMGAADNDTDFGAFDPEIAYNPTANEYLVVWRGDDDSGMLVADANEIFSQRLTAAGAEIGNNDLRISDMGAADNDTAFGAFDPAIAHNPVANEYLVAWRGDDDTGMLVNSEFEIFGQRLGASGVEIGNNDFRVSDMGTADGDTAFGGFDPAITYNPVANEYLVVWHGDDDIPPLVNEEFEIFGQRLDASANQAGANDFRISSMGIDGSTAFEAEDSVVAHNPAANQYLVVWDGDEHSATQTNDEFEIFGQRLTGDGVGTGPDGFRISTMGPDADPDFFAGNAVIAHGGMPDEFLVAWNGTDDAPPLADSEDEIYARGVAGVEPEPDPDPDPDPTADTEVTVRIAGKKLTLNRKRVTKVKLTCPAGEASPPCRGNLRLRTRKKVKSGARKRKIVLAKKKFSLDAGRTKKVKLKLKKKHARLVRRKKAARKVNAIANVRDAAGNSARVTKKMKLKPKKRKKKR